MATKRFTKEEARERKNARQREYQKRTGYAAIIKAQKNNTKRYELRFNINTDADIIQKMDAEKGNEGYAAYLKKLVREDIKKEN